MFAEATRVLIPSGMGCMTIHLKETVSLNPEVKFVNGRIKILPVLENPGADSITST